ncbi:hypothetical protein [Pseudoalteromonas sp. S16_S37]|uniref:hypothetical protein n=1 Tax=Pseudoalteromonas sp. S16_S37 TaxID=2720228 RepID=UPI0016803B60|nr:hypothetical protein [Pseudoalteromonas sp. S16_S37]MBD1581756.1 hypothetical protein [Pseudoalteromonas sp. S16_S37]
MMKKVLLVLGAVLVGYGAMQQVANHNIQTKLEQQLVNIQKQSGINISYQDVGVDLLSDTVNIHNLVVDDKEHNTMFSINKLTLIGYEPNKISELTRLKLTGLTYSQYAKSLLPEVASLLKDSRLNFDISLAYDSLNGDSTLVAKANAEQVVSWELGVALSNTTPLMESSLLVREQQAEPFAKNENELTSDEKQLIEAISRVYINALHFKVKNLGAMSEFLTQQLKINQYDDKTFLVRTKQWVEQSELKQEVKAGLMRFLNGQQMLNITMTLPEQTTLESLSHNLTMLNHDVSAFSEYVQLQVTGQ